MCMAGEREGGGGSQYKGPGACVKDAKARGKGSHKAGLTDDKVQCGAEPPPSPPTCVPHCALKLAVTGQQKCSRGYIFI